jgi:hypothetical protein
VVDNLARFPHPAAGDEISSVCTRECINKVMIMSVWKSQDLKRK